MNCACATLGIPATAHYGSRRHSTDPGTPRILPESSRGDGGFISTRLTSQRKLTGQQTALFVSYDGDCRYGGNVCHSGEPTSNGRTPVHARQHGHPPARESHRRKYLAQHHVRNTGGILNCGNWLRIEYPHADHHYHQTQPHEHVTE